MDISNFNWILSRKASQIWRFRPATKITSGVQKVQKYRCLSYKNRRRQVWSNTFPRIIATNMGSLLKDTLRALVLAYLLLRKAERVDAKFTDSKVNEGDLKNEAEGYWSRFILQTYQSYPPAYGSNPYPGIPSTPTPAPTPSYQSVVPKPTPAPTPSYQSILPKPTPAPTPSYQSHPPRPRPTPAPTPYPTCRVHVSLISAVEMSWAIRSMSYV